MTEHEVFELPVALNCYTGRGLMTSPHGYLAQIEAGKVGSAPVMPHATDPFIDL